MAHAYLNIHAPDLLRTGRMAPEIEGVDGFGSPMKLSDYRGKVVVLSFWTYG